MRKAALYLTGLHAKDRKWLLGQLPMASARLLDPLIKEVQPLIRDVRGNLDLLWGDLDGHKLVEVPTPDLLISALNTLDEVWAARMIGAAAPDHKEIYLAACSRQRALGIRRELEDLPGVSPPMLAQCMAEQLADMANAAGASAR
jgi:hypothetical protein